jgi:hypothetical protein
MGKLLLSLHVVAAVVFVGPVTVAVSPAAGGRPAGAGGRRNPSDAASTWVAGARRLALSSGVFALLWVVVVVLMVVRPGSTTGV